MITPGTILIEKGTLVPQFLRLEHEPYPSAWMSLKNNLKPYELQKELANTGWTFFYMAGKITTTAFGFDREKTVHTALKRLIANVRLQKCNCLEIDEVARHSAFRDAVRKRLRPLASHSKGFGLFWSRTCKPMTYKRLRFVLSRDTQADLGGRSKRSFFIEEASVAGECEGGVPSLWDWRSPSDPVAKIAPGSWLAMLLLSRRIEWILRS